MSETNRVLWLRIDRGDRISGDLGDGYSFTVDGRESGGSDGFAFYGPWALFTVYRAGEPVGDRGRVEYGWLTWWRIRRAAKRIKRDDVLLRAVDHD